MTSCRLIVGVIIGIFLVHAHEGTREHTHHRRRQVTGTVNEQTYPVSNQTQSRPPVVGARRLVGPQRRRRVRPQQEQQQKRPAGTQTQQAQSQQQRSAQPQQQQPRRRRRPPMVLNPNPNRRRRTNTNRRRQRVPQTFRQSQLISEQVRQGTLPPPKRQNDRQLAVKNGHQQLVQTNQRRQIEGYEGGAEGELEPGIDYAEASAIGPEVPEEADYSADTGPAIYVDEAEPDEPLYETDEPVYPEEGDYELEQLTDVFDTEEPPIELEEYGENEEYPANPDQEFPAPEDELSGQLSQGQPGFDPQTYNEKVPQTAASYAPQQESFGQQGQGAAPALYEDPGQAYPQQPEPTYQQGGPEPTYQQGGPEPSYQQVGPVQTYQSEPELSYPPQGGPEPQYPPQGGTEPSYQQGAAESSYQQGDPEPSNQQSQQEPTYQQGGLASSQQGGPKPSYQQGGPEPSYQQGGPKPSYQQGGPEPTYQQSQPEPSYQQGGPEPSYQQGRPEPSYQQSGPEPTYQQSQPEPSYQQGGPEPSYQQGGPEPSYQQGGPKPSYQQSQPEPSYQQGGPEPSYQQNQQNPSYQQDGLKPSYQQEAATYPAPAPATSAYSEPAPTAAAYSAPAPTSAAYQSPASAAYPSPAPAAYPSPAPVAYPSPAPAAYPSPAPAAYPSPATAAYPSPAPAAYPSPAPAPYPSPAPAAYPSPVPAAYPSPAPAAYPSPAPAAYVAPTQVSDTYPAPAPAYQQSRASQPTYSQPPAAPAAYATPVSSPAYPAPPQASQYHVQNSAPQNPAPVGQNYAAGSYGGSSQSSDFRVHGPPVGEANSFARPPQSGYEPPAQTNQYQQGGSASQNTPYAPKPQPTSPTGGYGGSSGGSDSQSYSSTGGRDQIGSTGYGPASPPSYPTAAPTSGYGTSGGSSPSGSNSGHQGSSFSAIQEPSSNHPAAPGGRGIPPAYGSNPGSGPSSGGYSGGQSSGYSGPVAVSGPYNDSPAGGGSYTAPSTNGGYQAPAGGGYSGPAPSNGGYDQPSAGGYGIQSGSGADGYSGGQSSGDGYSGGQPSGGGYSGSQPTPGGYSEPATSYPAPAPPTGGYQESAPGGYESGAPTSGGYDSPAPASYSAPASGGYGEQAGGGYGGSPGSDVYGLSQSGGYGQPAAYAPEPNYGGGAFAGNTHGGADFNPPQGGYGNVMTGNAYGSGAQSQCSSGNGDGCIALPPQSEGSCKYVSTCWDVSPQCAIAKGVPYSRTTGITCDECIALCLDSLSDSNTSPWECNAMTFDHRWLICDLFAIDGKSSPQYLVDFPGRDYFRPLRDVGNDQCANGGGGGGDGKSGASSCPAGQVERFARFEGWGADRGTEDTSSTTLETCASTCASNADCVGFDWDGKCFIITDAFVPGIDTLIPNNDVVYHWKQCFDEALVSDTEYIWDSVFPEYIWVGRAGFITDVNTLEDCFRDCLNAEFDFGFKCTSGMFVEADNVNPSAECILNEGNRNDDPSGFGPDELKDFVVYYFDIPPTGTKRVAARNRLLTAARRRLRTRSRLQSARTLSSRSSSNRVKSARTLSSRSSSRARGLTNAVRRQTVSRVTSESGWSTWSDCEGSVYRYRYKRCETDGGVNLSTRPKCGSEKQLCPSSTPSSFLVERSPSPTSTSSRNRLIAARGTALRGKKKTRKMGLADMNKFRSNFKSMRDSPLKSPVPSGGECKAVIDHRGRKRCPNGIRLTDGGQRIACKNPIDC